VKQKLFFHAELTLRLPFVLGPLVVVSLIGAGCIYGTLNAYSHAVEPTSIVTATETPTPSPTSTKALPATAIPIETLPTPFDYTVAAGDTCETIASTFGMDPRCIIGENNLSLDCNDLVVGQVLKIPYSVPPPLCDIWPLCARVDVTVQADKTLSDIAYDYRVSIIDIKEFNGLFTDNVFVGQVLKIPLCRRYRIGTGYKE
jgi:LysM repeat protein